MVKGMNALDWYHEEHCSHCDLPDDKCKAGSGREIACILAAILHELIVTRGK